MKKKGFTLVELLVVIAIISILATLAYASLGSARAKARDAKRISDLRQMLTAMELYFTDGSTYIKGCGNTTALEAAGTLTTACTNTDYIAWTNFKDPDNPTPTVACKTSTGAANSCAYVVGVAPTATGYEFCARMETKHAGINSTTAPALVKITNNGWDTGCSY